MPGGSRSGRADKQISARGRARLHDCDLIACVLMLVLGAGLWLSGTLGISLGILALAVATGLRSPIGSFWATCTAIPLVYHPIAIGSADFSLLELGILISVAGVALHTLGGAPVAQLRAWLSSGDDRFVWFGALFLIVAGAISLQFQPDRDHLPEALRTYRWVVCEAIGAFIAARFAIQRRGARPVVMAVALPATGIAVVALVDVIWGGGGFRADGVNRATATFLHPNNLALYLERAFILMLGPLILSGIDRSRFWAASIILVGCGLIVSLSRGMLPAIAVGVLVIGWFAGKRSVVYAAVGGLFLSLVAFALVASDRLRGSSSFGIFGARRNVWDAATAMIADYPVSGIGMDQFLYQHTPRYIVPEAWSERYLSHPHNIVLDAWLSLGLPGLLLLSASLLVLTGYAKVIRVSADSTFPVRAAAIAAIITGLVHGLVDNSYFLPELAAFTWILIALVVNAPAFESSKTPKTTIVVNSSGLSP